MQLPSHICILCSRLDLPGGIERAIVNTANLFQQKGLTISLLILDDHHGTFFPLHRDVKVYQEALHFGITQKGNFLSRKIDLLQHIKRLKVRLEDLKPDVILSTEYPITIAARLATHQSKSKLFAWEHHHFQHLDKNRFWRSLQKRFYPKLDGVICLNADEAELYKSARCKTVVVPNFVEKGKQADLESKSLLTVGWLSRTKGIDLVPTIAEKIFKRHPEWRWKIIGTGDEEKSLKYELEKRNLLNHVQIIAPTNPDLTAEYLTSSVYVMLSQFECFPMVLLEAMSHGVPCVAFDCPTGPKHIITNGEDGLLIEPGDIDSMVETVSSLIINENERGTFGTKAFQNIGQFSSKTIYQLWLELLH